MPKKRNSLLNKLSFKATYWIGTPQCLLLHATLFFLAFALIPLAGFDKVLLITTTVLSWEAIFIGIFIQMAVNRQQIRIKGIEDDVEDILEDTEELTEDPEPEIML